MTEEQIKVENKESPQLRDKDKDENVTEAVDAVVEEMVAEEPSVENSEAEQEEDIDELTALRELLAAAETQADEYLDDLRRERAAFQNYKKRQENERVELRQMATTGLLIQVLPIVDDFERALTAVPEDQSDQPWVEGMALIQRKLQTTMENTGVVPIEAEPGQPFDPFVHDAVSYEESEDYQEGEIIAVVQKGFRLGQRTLRPAMVRVAR